MEDSVDVEAKITRKSLVMPTLPKFLSIEEKKYLLAIERGDMANVRRMLQKAHRKKSFDINCVDSLGRGALSIAIDQENLEMVELLVIMGVETRDALLHAIHVEFVEAVELLLEHEELIHKEGEPYSWQKVDINTAMFTPDITPLTLAAHRNNYEILKILLDRGATIPMPHDIKCGCDECIKESEEDYLRHSLARLNEYKALASPSLIALSSSDPILTAFQLSWELRNLAFAEPWRVCFSALKLVHLFSINPHLGPLQISLGRMVIDIVKFFFIYTLVLFAFACGLNQLLWYFSDLEKKKCYHLPSGEADFDNAADSCMKWRRFANVFESSQSLFWASFGMVDLESFELTGIKTYTRFWGLLMFGSYSVINVIVLLNLLIAMMSNSYAMIDEHSDTEWKFARTKLWMSYFEESATLPSPFNIFPKPKDFFKLLGLRKKDKMRRMSTKRRNREEKERDYRYTAVMRALVWRYVSAMHRKLEENAVTEDDVNELKSDISSFRYELLEVLQKNGMDISAAEMKEKAILGKKMKVWERRLMKDFKVAPVVSEEEEEFIYQPPPEGENSLAKFRRIAKLAVVNSNLSKWRQVVKGACIASQIGHCHRRDSFKKQQNLQRAMEEAKKLKVKSPEQSRATTPIQLPDTTGSNIMKIVRGITPEVSDCPTPRDKSPFISISSPAKTPEKEPDLINLESAKTSPILPLKSSSDDVSLESIEKIVNERGSLPTSPTSSDEKSLDSLSKKAFFTPEENEKKCEEIETKNVTFAFNLVDESGKIEEETIKRDEEKLNFSKVEQPSEEESNDPPEKVVETKTEEKKEIEESVDQPEEIVETKTEEQKKIEEKKESQEEICVKSEATEEKEVKKEEKIEIEKSPMAVRNIQRIGDRNRRQPKTGWL
ncbi:transient-receptor-potential-like protein [Tribolium madens]|uniref:transient-receptor-potential-like protein n=1 Tax=Tribolium madens TaxID=41895 RepID=UPI001CF73B16|nr:transient-receptor-potential-like protein [Tribolium madens]